MKVKESIVEEAPKTETKATKRKMAPKIRVTNLANVNERAEIVAMFCPEAVEAQELVHLSPNKATAIGEYTNKLHAFFADPRIKPEIYEARGYTAVLNGEGEHVTHIGDPLYTIPMEEFLERRAEGEEISRQAVEISMNAEDDNAKEHGLKRDLAL